MMEHLNILTVEEIVSIRDSYDEGTDDWILINNMKAEKMIENKPSTNENIIAFKESDLDFIDYGFQRANGQDKKLNYINYIEDKRAILEYHPVYRHPIPYVIIKFESKFFFILREGGSGEERLIGKKGLVGGHFGKVVDSDNKNNYPFTKHLTEGLSKELFEEVGLTTYDDKVESLKFVGSIKEKKEKQNVNGDHLAMVYLLELNEDNIKSLEDGIIKGMWIEREALAEHYDSFEDWSKIVYKEVIKKLD